MRPATPDQPCTPRPAGTRTSAAPPAVVFDRAYFREVYNSGSSRTWLDRARDNKVVSLIDRHASTGSTDRLLEVGCGYGYLLRRLGDRFELYAVDVSPHAAARAKNEVEFAGVVCADVQEPLPFAQSFDVIIAMNVLEHLPDPERAVRNIADAVAPGGLCVIHMPTINGAITRTIYGFTYAANDATHVYRPSGTEVRRLFEANGFETLHESYAPHVPRWLWRKVKVHPAYLAAFRRA